MWSVTVHWICRLWGLPEGVGQGQPLPVFCLGPPGICYKAFYRWLLLVLVLEMSK